MTRNPWNRESQAIAVAMPFPVAMEESAMRARLEAVRDTLIVLVLQIVFRATQFLRHWNY
jgi:hypothetical protein